MSLSRRGGRSFTDLPTKTQVLRKKGRMKRGRDKHQATRECMVPFKGGYIQPSQCEGCHIVGHSKGYKECQGSDSCVVAHIKMVGYLNCALVSMVCSCDISHNVMYQGKIVSQYNTKEVAISLEYSRMYRR